MNVGQTRWSSRQFLRHQPEHGQARPGSYTRKRLDAVRVKGRSERATRLRHGTGRPSIHVVALGLVSRHLCASNDLFVNVVANLQKYIQISSTIPGWTRNREAEELAHASFSGTHLLSKSECSFVAAGCPSLPSPGGMRKLSQQRMSLLNSDRNDGAASAHVGKASPFRVSERALRRLFPCTLHRGRIYSLLLL
jgi:hypothetical protein